MLSGRYHGGAGERDPRHDGLGGGPESAPIYLSYYGSSAVFTDVRDKLKAALDALVIIMAGGYNPTLSYAYNKHQVPNLELNAVSVEVESGDSTDSVGGEAGKVAFIYRVTASIRVHTSYSNGKVDPVANVYLLDSLNTYFQQNRNLGDGYRILRIHSVEAEMEFTDSFTRGAQFLVDVAKPKEYVVA